ncbi:DC-STAMP domain-containing protein 2 isoform X1 [Drosophila miranda]|uniref:DC-STAMP domain-containing protein 2 isoform X1 n=2 Tax=Drosophila miranda TaxID=7229 RepID=UPI00143F1D60|nr:DC-STAMP domain-containing protein 2 isoform X1 [Drosophila miranda]
MSNSEDDTRDTRGRDTREKKKYWSYYRGPSKSMPRKTQHRERMASKRVHVKEEDSENDEDIKQETKWNLRSSSTEGEAAIYQLHPESEEQVPEHYPSRDSFSVSGWDRRDKITLYMIAGYVLGILLVLIWYYRHPRRASLDLTEKWLLIVLLFLFMMILGYSRAARCVVALIFPTLGSHRGRALLIALAFFVAGTGPVMNIIRNIDIMGHSLSCGQSRLRQALTPMQDIMGQPINIVEHSVQGTITEVRKIMESLDKVLKHLEEPIAEIHANFKSCGEWLRLQQGTFEQQMGTPYDRCLGAGSVSTHDCQTKFGAKRKECNVKDRFVWFCENLKPMASFFERNVQLHHEIFEEIFQRSKQSFINIRKMFVVGITFVGKQKINGTNDSLGRDSDVILEHEIGRTLEAQRRAFILFFVCLDLVVFILVFTVILRSIYFRMLYLGNHNFNNVYITHAFYVYDRRSEPFGILPLHSVENIKFVKITSLRLLPEEFQIMTRSILFLFITGMQLFLICFVDYCLYTMLSMMSHHAHQTAGLKPPAYTRIVITKGGMIGDILRSLVRAFEPYAKNLDVGTEKCLPVPGEPNIFRYYEVLVLCVLAWLLLIWEPYSLRVRHWVMAVFYPIDAYRRVRHLHHRITEERMTFIKNSRRRVRSLYLYSDGNQFMYLSWFSSLKIWCLSGCPSSFVCKTCVICTKALTTMDHIYCDTPNCRGVYCQRCFIDSNNHCILCNPPSLYWDYSDVSETEESSDAADDNNDDLVDDKHVDIKHVDAKHVDIKHVEDKHVDAKHVDAKHVDAKHVDAKHVDDKHVDNNHVDDKHVDNNRVDNNRVDNNRVGSVSDEPKKSIYKSRM